MREKNPSSTGPVTQRVVSVKSKRLRAPPAATAFFQPSQREPGAEQISPAVSAAKACGLTWDTSGSRTKHGVSSLQPSLQGI